MGTMASQITNLTIVYSTVYSDAEKNPSKLRVTGLCAGNSPVTGEFPAQKASNAENVSIWWRDHEGFILCCMRYDYLCVCAIIDQFIATVDDMCPHFLNGISMIVDFEW